MICDERPRKEPNFLVAGAVCRVVITVKKTPDASARNAIGNLLSVASLVDVGHGPGSVRESYNSIPNKTKQDDRHAQATGDVVEAANHHHHHPHHRHHHLKHSTHSLSIWSILPLVQSFLPTVNAPWPKLRLSPEIPFHPMHHSLTTLA